jgi:hypothetical protein
LNSSADNANNYNFESTLSPSRCTESRLEAEPSS